MGQERRAPVGNLERWCKRAQRALGKFKAIPTVMRLVLICIAVLVVFSVTNLAYQILHKPTEVFALIPGESNKAPIETWRRYAPLFREYSTASISPELLAALAQVESAGNPIARTYWRWGLISDPFAVYQPASSAVGMYQMTDAALSEARSEEHTSELQSHVNLVCRLLLEKKKKKKKNINIQKKKKKKQIKKKKDNKI